MVNLGICDEMQSWLATVVECREPDGANDRISFHASGLFHGKPPASVFGHFGASVGNPFSSVGTTQLQHARRLRKG
jgi:hypothetical protein